MKKWLKISLWLLAITAVVVLIAFKLRHNKAAATTEMQKELQPVGFTVEAAKAEQRDFSGALHYRGTVEPGNLFTVYAEADGKIINCQLQKGSYVAKGQVVATVDRSIRNANLTINQLSVEKARADREQAAKTTQRYKDLLQQNNATAIELENAQLQEQAAIAQYKTLLQQVQISQRQITQTTVLAPASGIVVAKTVNSGDFVQPGTTLGTIAVMGTVLVKIWVPEATVVQLKVGQPVELRADVYPDAVFKGNIKTIIPVASEAKTFPVEVAVDNSRANQLMAGMSMAVVLNQQAEQRALVIPRTALTGNFSQPQVYKIAGNNQPVKAAITIGRSFGEYVEVTSGIAEGDIVITSGQANIEVGKILKGYTLKQ